MFTAGVNQAMVLGNVQQRLTNLRDAIKGVQWLDDWASGVAASDLEALGFSPADSTTLLSAITEANTIATDYDAGATFQRQVIGPQ